MPPHGAAPAWRWTAPATTGRKVAALALSPPGQAVLAAVALAAVGLFARSALSSEPKAKKA